MKNNFLKEMSYRGYLNQCTDLDKLDEICNKKTITAYIGFDCTASSLHVVSLLQIMILKLLQKHGHRPIVLLGGGTTLICDPSGKDSTRKILDQKSITNNITQTGTLNRQLFRFGANLQAAEYTYIRASWGEGYRFPSIAESFVNLNLGGIGIFPNPKLEEENGWYAEVGFKQGFALGKDWRGYSDLTFFAMRYNNMVEVNFGTFGDPVPGAHSALEAAGLGFSFQNVGETLIMGGEITIAGTGKIGRMPLTILAGYTYTRSRSLNWEDPFTLYDVNGDILTDIPSRTGDLTYAATSSG